MIRVENKELLFSREDSRIGAQGDASSVEREFVVPRVQNDGIDIANLTFKLDMYYTDTETSDVSDLETSYTDDDITLIWTVTETTASHTGAIVVNIRAFDATGTVKWRSFKGVVYIEDTNGTVTPSTTQLSELEQLEAQIDNIISSESSRVEAEEARVEAEEAREAAEETRQSTFETNEETRQSTFETNEAEREATFTEAIEEFEETKDELEAFATEAESYAHGGTGSRTGEDTDNAMYYSNSASGSALSAEESATSAQEAAATAATLIGIIIPTFEVDFTTGELMYTDYSTLESSVTFEIDSSTGNLEYTITT